MGRVIVRAVVVILAGGVLALRSVLPIILGVCVVRRLRRPHGHQPPVAPNAESGLKPDLAD